MEDTATLNEYKYKLSSVLPGKREDHSHLLLALATIPSFCLVSPAAKGIFFMQRNRKSKDTTLPALHC